MVETEMRREKRRVIRSSKSKTPKKRLTGTPRQRLFVTFYLNPESKTFLNAHKAAVAAGYSDEGNSGYSTGCRLTRAPWVREYIEAFLATREVSFFWVVDKINRIARGEPVKDVPRTEDMSDQDYAKALARATPSAGESLKALEVMLRLVELIQHPQREAEFQKSKNAKAEAGM